MPMMMRKKMRPHSPRKKFPPESYGNFPIVKEEQIAELRQRMATETADEEWDVVEDVIEH